MSPSEKVQARRKAVLEIAKKHGVENVRVFGSVARGEDHDQSDVDLLVTLSRKRGLLDLVGFQQDIEELLETSVDVVEDEGLSPFLRNRILAEAKPL